MSRVSALGVSLVAILVLASTAAGQVTIESGLDAFTTGPGTTVDLPPLPAGFFGPGSDPVPAMPGFELTSYPFPDIFGVPDPFPQDQFDVQVEWVDRHGNVVGPDSQHAVGTNATTVRPDPPYNFDTVIRRTTSATFNNPGDTATVDIEMVWLSLRSAEPITVSFSDGSSSEKFDVFVGLSSTTFQAVGRMGLTAATVGPGIGSGTAHLGVEGDMVDDEFDMGFLDFFIEYPEALGLPVLYQLRFINQGDPDDVAVFDDPEGLFGGPELATRSVFHNETGRFEVPFPPSIPILPPDSVVNGASFRPATEPNSAIAPGAIVSIFGTDLASDTVFAGEVPLPVMLGDTSVTFNDIPASLFFVSPTQINAQVPFELMIGAGLVSVQITRGSETSEVQPIEIAAVSPGIFTLNEQGTGPGAILHADDFQPVSESNPAQPGEFLAIFCGGLGPVQPEVPSGEVAPSTPPLAETLSTPLVNIGGIPAEVTFSGLAPGFVGLNQVNVRVPEGAAPGSDVPVEITQDGITSNIATIPIELP